MFMKLGRNDPCHCGSGKKYKKCCLQKDEEAEHNARMAIQPPPLAPPQPLPPRVKLPPPDPHVEARNAAFDARWAEFENQDYEGQVALFLKTLEEKELMDDDMAFEMVDLLFIKSAEHHDRERYNTLLDTFQERLPDVYAENAAFYLHRQINNVLAIGRHATLPRFTQALAHIADQDFDTFIRVESTLAYHGQLALLIEMSQLAWPHVRNARDILSWAIHDFAKRAQAYQIFDYVERVAAPNPADPELKTQLEYYEKNIPERISQYLALLTGSAERVWTMNDFQFKPLQPDSRDQFDEDEDKDLEEEEEERYPLDQARQNLHDLSVEFLGFLRREEGVSYPKAELGRQEIVQYLFDRFDGRLAPKKSMFDAVLRKKPKSKPIRRPPEHVLCPDRQTLDHYLADLINILSYQPHKTVALLELVPAWLRFLETRRLIDSQQRKKTLTALYDLDTYLLKVLREPTADPALVEGLKSWRDNTERE